MRMKTGFAKQLLSILLCVTLLLTYVPTAAFAVEETADSVTLYLVPNQWTAENAGLAVYYFTETEDSWVKMEKVQDNLYKTVTPIPTSGLSGVIFVRYNSAQEPSWDSCWNHTTDLTFSGTQNTATIPVGGGNGTFVTWSHTHLGGTATCTTQAVCESCGEGYGELVDHTIENHVCTLCGAMEIVVSFGAGDFEWETGDKLELCRVYDSKEEYIIFTAAVGEDGTVTWIPDKPLYWGGTGAHKLVVTYPGDTGLAWQRGRIQADQSTPTKLKENDLMNAIWSGNPTTEPITLNLKHRLAKVTVNYEVAKDVTATVSKAEVYTIWRYLVYDGETLDRSEQTGEASYDLWITSYLSGNQFTAIVSPDAYAADGNFIKITLSDGTVYEVKMNEAVTFAEGGEYPYKVIIIADGAHFACADGCTNFTYTDNGDGTHSFTCSVCGGTGSEDHTGGEGTATCISGKICELCESEYGEVNAANHSYTSNVCCGTCGENAKWVIADGVLTISGTGAMDDYEGVWADNLLSGTTAPWNGIREQIRSVVVEAGITTIGDYAFGYQCSNLTAISIADTVTSIGSSAFYNSGLTEIAIPASVKTIKQGAFNECFQLTRITLNEGLETIGHFAFVATGIQSLTIPESVEYIGRNLVDRCTNVVRVSITGDSPDVDTNLLLGAPEGLSVYIYGKTASGYHQDGWKNPNVTLFFVDQLTAVTKPAGQTYTGKAFQPEVTVTNYKGDVLTEGTDYTVVYSGNTNAGTATVTVTGIGNYGGTLETGFTILPKAITVTAKNAGKVYGEKDPTFEYEVEGLEENDTLTGQLSRESGENVGPYAITQGTLTAGDNYVITFNGAALTINQKELTIYAKDQTITYGETISASEITAEGLVDGHSASATLTPSTAKVTTGGTIMPSNTVVTANGTDVTANYSILQMPGKLVIQPDTSKINFLTADNVTSANAGDISSVLEAIKQADSVTEEWKALAENCETLLDVIAAADAALDTENTEKAEGITAEDVALDDKEALADAKTDLEKALEENGGNYTEAEKKAIEEDIRRIEAASEVVESVENATAAISQLPETAEPDDEEAAEKLLAAKEAYEALTDHGKSLVEDSAKEKLDALTAAMTAYKITAGDGGKWTDGSDSSLSFTANGPLSKFVGIEVDGKEVAATHYTAESGSTVITLKASYLDTLSSGEHTLTVRYTDGETSGSFHVQAKATTPSTGDASHILLHSAVLAVSALLLAALFLESRKRRQAK